MKHFYHCSRCDETIGYRSPGAVRRDDDFHSGARFEKKKNNTNKKSMIITRLPTFTLGAERATSIKNNGRRKEISTGSSRYDFSEFVLSFTTDWFTAGLRELRSRALRSRCASTKFNCRR